MLTIFIFVIIIFVIIIIVIVIVIVIILTFVIIIIITIIIIVIIIWLFSEPYSFFSQLSFCKKSIDPLSTFPFIFLSQDKIKVLCEQTRELTHDFLDYV